MTRTNGDMRPELISVKKPFTRHHGFVFHILVCTSELVFVISTKSVDYAISFVYLLARMLQVLSNPCCQSTSLYVCVCLFVCNFDAKYLGT